MGAERILYRVLSGTADAAIRFDDLCRLLESLGFDRRVRGSHHLFRKSGIDGIINKYAEGWYERKPYQVKQVRAIIINAKLGSKR